MLRERRSHPVRYKSENNNIQKLDEFLEIYERKVLIIHMKACARGAGGKYL